MAKRRSTSRQRMRAPQRVSRNSIANPRLLRPIIRPVDLRVFEDRRTFHPSPVRWPAQVHMRGARPSRLVERGRAFSFLSPAFVAPKRVALCVRRKTRREVILALGHGRSGSRAPRRRNQWSNVKC